MSSEKNKENKTGVDEPFSKMTMRIVIVLMSIQHTAGNGRKVRRIMVLAIS